jgi:hypothetical protein
MFLYRETAVRLPEDGVLGIGEEHGAAIYAANELIALPNS